MILAAVVGALVQPLAATGDAAWFGRAGDRLLSPDGLNVFDEPGLQVGPTYLVIAGVIRAAARLLGLPVWPVTGAVESVLLVAGVLLVLRWARAGVAARWAVAGSLVLAGPLSEGLLNGHPEELGAAVVLVLAGFSARRGSVVLAPLLVGLATTSKLWGVLGVVLFLVALPRGWQAWRALAIRAGVFSAVVAIAYVPFLTMGTVRTFDFVWQFGRYSTVALLTGFTGEVPFTLRLAQVVVAVGVGLLLVGRGAEPPVVVLGVVAARILTDPLQLTYYFATLMLLVVMAAWSAPGLVGPRTRLLAVVLVPVEVVGVYLLPPRPLSVVHLVLLVGVLVACFRMGRGWAGLGRAGLDRAGLDGAGLERVEDGPRSD